MSLRLISPDTTGVYGTSSAATTVSSLLASLPSIRIGLLVGIGGGIARPSKDQDIRLGDIVVSQPDGTTGGVCQYDLFKAEAGGKRERKGFLGRPPTVLLNAFGRIQADHERKDFKAPYHLQRMLEENPKMAEKSKKSPGYVHQGSDNDRLFQAYYAHASGSDCRDCDKTGEVLRDTRNTTDPEIYYGTIASGNTLVKDAAERDRIVDAVGENCLCFEMEAAGLMNSFPCLVIRGICDYADAHKNDRWQRCASATAAAYAKELLAYVPAVEVQETKQALEVMQSVDQKLDLVGHTINATKTKIDNLESSNHTDKIERWLNPPDPSTNFNHAKRLRHEGTGAWLLDHPVFQSWSSGSRRHLWLHGLSGCGKTVLSTTVLDHIAEEKDRLLIRFFFDFSDKTKQTVDGMLRSLAFQLYQSEAGASVLDASFQTHQDGRQQPATKTLKDVVIKMLRVQKKVSVVLDALDESTTRSDLLLWIKDIASGLDLGHVQLMCTSRPEAEFVREIPEMIGSDNKLPLDKQAVKGDIDSYVSTELTLRRKFQDMRLSGDLLSRIRSKVGGGGADGMFRWAACQLNSLASSRSTKALKDAIDNLPRDLKETYERMLHGIPEEERNSAIRLLQFLVYSSQPLTVTEAVDILATNTEAASPCFAVEGRVFRDDDVLQSVPGLTSIVEVMNSYGNIRRELHLAHFSVKEFLLNRAEFDRLTASVSITKTCLTYLTDITGDDEYIDHLFHFATLAATMWIEHGALAESSDDIFSAILRLLNDDKTFGRWIRLFTDFKWTRLLETSGETRLYYPCYYGLLRVAQELINEGADVNSKGIHDMGLLRATSARGHVEVIRFLLEKGADINAQGSAYGIALRAALAQGHDGPTPILLQHIAHRSSRKRLASTPLVETPNKLLRRKSSTHSMS
ncbi:Vegetative incompatibility protein HET-E-1 like [Verticillium longisporum]|nr:Vegetative incompatibility protein HET-E-1 like [Verticillium longisporum]